MEDRSLYLKQRIIAIYIELMRNGTPKQKIHVYSEVARLLIAEHKVVNRGFVRRIVLKFKSTGSVHRMNGGGRPNILSSNPNVNAIIENAMVNNDETTAADLLTLLQEGGYDASIPTINRIRRKLGWTLKGTRYCQLIRENNKPKRLDWAILNQNEQFDDVIWSDETSVPLEQYKRTCYRKKGTNFSKKPKPKHPLKVHVWAGISKKGKTKVCIFNGIMDAQMYVKILEDTLLPFIHEKYPEGHRFMQDNDPKHTSRLAKCFMQEKNINWWKTPAESPDMNPIENLWHELKEYSRKYIKPRTQEELVNGILQFWETVTVEKCTRYINHLKRVLPEVIRREGRASGF